MQSELFAQMDNTVTSQQAKRLRFPYWEADSTEASHESPQLFEQAQSSVTRYGSGASAKWDFLGYQLAKAPVGVTATELGPHVLALVGKYAAAGGRVFVDSGAFGARGTGRALDFQKAVFPVYDALLSHEGAAPQLLMVMPDVVGFQEKSLQLQRQHLAKILSWMDAGAEAIFPIQDGSKEPEQRYFEIQEMLAGRPFVVGVPSNAEAWTTSQTVKFAAATQPQRMHLLGLAKKRAVEELAGRINAVSPGTVISCDSCTIIAHVGGGRRLTDRARTRLDAAAKWSATARVEELPFLSLAELMYGVVYEPSTLTAKQARSLGEALHDLAPHKPNGTQRSWGDRFAQCASTGFQELFSELDPDEEWLDAAAAGVVQAQVYTPLVRKILSGPIRAYEVARVVLQADPDWMAFKRFVDGCQHPLEAPDVQISIGEASPETLMEVGAEALAEEA